jgi:transposase
MRRTADPLLLEQQRFNAARMADQGVEPKVIAAGLGFNDQTVRRWLRDYRRGGMDALKARLHPGPTPRMSDEQKRQLLELLEKPPESYAAEGLAGALWTAAKIAALIKGRFGVSYHPSHVGQMMHELGYSQQLPHKRPKERDEEEVERWRQERWPEIVRRAVETKARVAFVDESGFLMNPLRKKVWARKGQTPQLPHRTRNHEKVSVIGGLVATPGPKRRVKLLTQWHPGGSVDQGGVVQFLGRLLRECPGRLIVVWDNLPAHRSKLVKAFCAAHPRLWLENLPGYAPDLNPIELVWCMSKYHRLANHGIAELEELHRAAQEATDEVAGEQELLRSCIRHTGLADALYPDGDQ